MPAKLSLGLSKKIGLPSYSSIGASCQLECEIELSGLQDANGQFQAEAQRLYGLCRQAVQEQLARETQRNGETTSRSNGQASGVGPLGSDDADEPPPGHDAAGCREAVDLGLSERQLAFLQDLASQIRGLGIKRLPVLVSLHFDKNLTELSSAEASRLIGMLRQVRAGSLRLETLLDADAA